MMEKISLWQRWAERGDAQGRTVAYGVLLLFVVSAAFVVFGANPWIEGFFDKVDAGEVLLFEDVVVAEEAGADH